MEVNKDQKKIRRLLSNRESARRSRLKKQHQLNSLLIQLRKLEEENQQMMINMSLSNQLYMDIEAENSILRAQIMELNHRLISLKEIVDVVGGPSSSSSTSNGVAFVDVMNNGGLGLGLENYCSNGVVTPFVNQSTHGRFF